VELNREVAVKSVTKILIVVSINVKGSVIQANAILAQEILKG
jgi:hypothetical protein